MKKYLLYAIAFILLQSCSKGNRFDRCKDFDIDGCPFGVYMYPDLDCYECPCFNPNNNNEFIALHQKDGNTSLVKVNLHTNVKTVLPNNALINGQPQWGKKGWIVFYTRNWKIWRIKDDGSGIKQLTFGYCDQNPRFNSDGDKIIYTRSIKFSASQLKKKPELALLNKLFVINVDGIVLDSFCRPFDTHAWSLWRIASWQKEEIVANYGPNNDLTICGLAVYDNNGNEKRVLYDDGEFQTLRDLEWIWGTNEVMYTADNDGLVHFRNGKKKRIKKSCHEVFYKQFSISNDGEKIIIEKIYSTLGEPCTVSVDAVLVLMDINGDNEKEIEIPE